MRLEIRTDPFRFDFSPHGRVEISKLQDVILFQRLRGNGHLFRNETNCSNAAAFAITAILHLHGRHIQMISTQRHRCHQTNNATPALRRFFPPLADQCFGIERHQRFPCVPKNMRPFHSFYLTQSSRRKENNFSLRAPRPLRLISLFHILHEVSSAAKLQQRFNSQPVHVTEQLLAPGMIQIDDPLRRPIRADQFS